MVGRKEELDDLIAAFGRRVHEAPSILIASFDHVRNCAICLDELRKLRLTIKRPQ